MPIISRVGTRSRKVRAVYACIFAVLIVGAISMIYPFMLMLTGSVKSGADSLRLTPYPEYWFSDRVLFQKYAESKYDASMARVERSWGVKVSAWHQIEPPGDVDPQLLADYLEWRATCPWWALGHNRGGFQQLFNEQRFNALMYQRFDGDLDQLRQALDLPLKSWNAVKPPAEVDARYWNQQTPLHHAFDEFAQTRPVDERIIESLDARYCRTYLVPRYTDDIARYNKLHGTSFTSYDQVVLDATVPPADEAADSSRVRQDWVDYVRNELPLIHIRLKPLMAEPYRIFLKDTVYEGQIQRFNRVHGTDYTSFYQVPLQEVMPQSNAAQVEWEKFIRSAKVFPLEKIEVQGPRQSFEQFVAAKRGVSVASISPLRMPIMEADWHDMMRQRGALRWAFTTRNYKTVLNYVVLHGNGILNTIIYCMLAVGTALIINPVAAYALSRYKPPSTYTVLLFCMATMAFPGEVTMIPGFLLLKRFPLGGIAGGLGVFLAVLWLTTRIWPRLPELLRLTVALGAGILAGAWAMPMVLGTSHVSLLNSFAALVLPGMANGFSIFLLKGFFDSLPQDLYEAADIDGASEWTKFWMITMSLSKPILAVIALGAFTGAYSAFMMALIIIPDQSMWTMMVWLYQLQQQSHQTVIYASLVIAAIPTFLVFVFCQNLIMRGIVVPVEK